MQFSTVHPNCLLDSNHLAAHVCFRALRLTCICVHIHMLLFLKKGWSVWIAPILSQPK